MEYRKIGDNYYIRMDRGDELSATSSQYARKNPYLQPYSLESAVVRVQSYRCSFQQQAVLRQEMSSNTFSDEEQAEFWDDFSNLHKAKIIR